MAEVGSVLVAMQSEFHPYQRVETQDTEWFRRVRLVHIWSRQSIVGADFFPGEDDVDRVPRFGVGSVEEPINAGHVPIDKALANRRGPIVFLLTKTNPYAFDRG